MQLQGLTILTKRADFLAAASARRVSTPAFTLQYRLRQCGEADGIRVGFTCSKKVGNAIARNHAKRRLREIARIVPAARRDRRHGLCPYRPPRQHRHPQFRGVEGRSFRSTQKGSSMSPLAHLFALPVRVYRLVISPLISTNCRFHPTCSAYALEALEKHGAFKGAWLAIKRIARCHPWGGSGIDNVPDKE